MKTNLLFMAACAFCMCASAKGGHAGGGHTGGGHTGSGHVNSSSHSISGHTTKNGTHVAPSQATNPNTTKTDNYSEKGNVNPYTDKQGTKQ